MDTNRLIAEKFMSLHPSRAAHVVETLTEEETAALVSETPVRVIVPVLNALSPGKSARAINLVPAQRGAVLLEAMDPHSAQAMLRHLEQESRGKLMAALDPALASTLQRNLEQESGTVGSLMLPVNRVFQEDMTVREVMEILKKQKEEIIHPLLVRNSKGVLAGHLPLPPLLLAERSEPLLKYLDPEIPSFLTDTPLTAVTEHPGWYNFPSMPVVDNTGLLVGILPRELAFHHDRRKERMPRDLLDTTLALGELYRIGLAGFLQSVNRRT
jgi:Mg/Co/Ni transporter MgtE